MLGIVTIDYKNPQMTIDFVCRELPKIDVSYICVIVINGCTEEELNIVQKGTGGIVAGKKVDKKSNIYIVPSPDNLGFAKGNNLGVKFLEEKLIFLKCIYLSCIILKNKLFIFINKYKK